MGTTESPWTIDRSTQNAAKLPAPASNKEGKYQMNSVEPKSKKYLSNNVGLQGLDRDINRARLDAGKCVSFLASAMANRYPIYTELMAAIDSRLKLQNGAAHAYHTVNTLYVKPAYPNGIEFTYKFLCGTPYQNLLAFAPYLKKVYTVPRFALADKIWLTVWSIEVFFARHNGIQQWWDLRELTPDEIKGFVRLMQCESSPTSNGTAARSMDVEAAPVKEALPSSPPAPIAGQGSGIETVAEECDGMGLSDDDNPFDSQNIF